MVGLVKCVPTEGKDGDPAHPLQNPAEQEGEDSISNSVHYQDVAYVVDANRTGNVRLR